MLTRLLSADIASSPKSVLLLGPRQTGKSTLMKSLKPELEINLAQETTYLAFASRPSELEERLASGVQGTVFIDEVQRIPSLLNTIQAIIDTRTAENAAPVRFLLTGSSARKLRRGQANLLPGRVWTYHLGPLAAVELNYQVDSQRAMAVGALPEPYLQLKGTAAQKLLRSYAGSYLREEIQAEALTRSLESFSRFLDIAAQWSGQSLDFSKMAARAKVARRSAMRYFEILEDTLIARRLESPPDLPAENLVKHPKFYFFDCGVLNALVGHFTPSPDRRGVLFEHLWLSQVWASASAKDVEVRIYSFRTRGGLEVDFVIDLEGQRWLVEAKSTLTPDASDTSVLAKACAHFGKDCPKMVVHPGTIAKRIGNVSILPWQRALKEMGL